MAFSIVGYVTVAYQEPVYNEQNQVVGYETQEETFNGSDFGWEDGEGTETDDEGNVKHSGIWIAFGADERAVVVSVNAYRGGQCFHWSVTPRNCTILSEELDYEF